MDKYMTYKDITIQAMKGAELRERLEEIAGLRIEVFRAFPYLYDGSLEYELKYLQKYLNSERAGVFCAVHEGKIIGASTCLPLVDEEEEVRAAFRHFEVPIEEIFYFGESVLLEPYRGHGIGHRFFDHREEHVASFDAYKMMCFCAVKRPEDHPNRPPDYRPNDAFWTKRGYVKQSDLVCYMDWPDIGAAASSEKPLEFWIRYTS